MERHLKHVAEVLLRFHKRRGFDHLILSGPQEALPEFERHLHDYLKRKIAARVSLPMTASAADVLDRSLAVEEELEAGKERRLVDRLHAEAAAGRQAVLGLEPALQALNEGRVDTLVVPAGVAEGGLRCPDCGLLTTSGGPCARCGGTLEPIPDVVASAVALALRQSSRVETVSHVGAYTAEEDLSATGPPANGRGRGNGPPNGSIGEPASSIAPAPAIGTADDVGALLRY